MTGRESRLPIKVKGHGIGPHLVFSFDTLDIQKVFVHSAHAYEVLCTYIILLLCMPGNAHHTSDIFWLSPIRLFWRIKGTLMEATSFSPPTLLLAPFSRFPHPVESCVQENCRLYRYSYIRTCHPHSLDCLVVSLPFQENIKNYGRCTF